MDKRLFLALLLTALVVVLTPIVFPTPRPSARSAASTSGTDTLRAGGGTYRLINPGASPVSVVLDDYRSRRPGGIGRGVDLVRPGDQLLHYRVALGADTIALDTIPMRASVSSGSNGSTVVT